VVELEAGREAVRTELETVQRKMSSLDDEYQKKCREQQAALEDRAISERQAAEQRRHLENTLETAGAQLAEVRVELGAAGGRVEALELELGGTESARHDAEWKLATVVSALRRTVGITTPAGDHAGAADERRAARSRSCSPRKGQSASFSVMFHDDLF